MREQAALVMKTVGDLKKALHYCTLDKLRSVVGEIPLFTVTSAFGIVIT